MYVEKKFAHENKNKNNKNKFTFCKSTKFVGAYRNVNLNSNRSIKRKCALLQQNSKLHNKFKEIDMKNAILLAINSNATMIRNRNYAE